MEEVSQEFVNGTIKLQGKARSIDMVTLMYGCWTNYCNTRLNIHAQFRKSTRKKMRHKWRTKLAAALRTAANFVRRGCRVFARGLAKMRVNFQASVAIICPTTVLFFRCIKHCAGNIRQIVKNGLGRLGSG